MDSDKKHSSFFLILPYQWIFCMGWVKMGLEKGLMTTHPPVRVHHMFDPPVLVDLLYTRDRLWRHGSKAR